MILLSKSIDDYMKEFEAKEQKYEDAYQTSGNPSSLRTREKYSDLIEICLAAKRNQEEEDTKRVHRQKNVNEYIRKVEDRKMYSTKTYTILELVEELKKLANVIC